MQTKSLPIHLPIHLFIYCLLCTDWYHLSKQHTNTSTPTSPPPHPPPPPPPPSQIYTRPHPPHLQNVSSTMSSTTTECSLLRFGKILKCRECVCLLKTPRVCSSDNEETKWLTLTRQMENSPSIDIKPRRAPGTINGHCLVDTFEHLPALLSKWSERHVQHCRIIERLKEKYFFFSGCYPSKTENTEKTKSAPTPQYQ